MAAVSNRLILLYIYTRQVKQEISVYMRSQWLRSQYTYHTVPLYIYVMLELLHFRPYHRALIPSVIGAVVPSIRGICSHTRVKVREIGLWLGMGVFNITIEVCDIKRGCKNAVPPIFSPVDCRNRQWKTLPKLLT